MHRHKLFKYNGSEIHPLSEKLCLKNLKWTRPKILVMPVICVSSFTGNILRIFSSSIVTHCIKFRTSFSSKGNTRSLEVTSSFKQYYLSITSKHEY